MSTIPSYYLNRVEHTEFGSVVHSIDMLTLTFNLRYRDGSLPDLVSSSSEERLNDAQAYATDIANIFRQIDPSWTPELGFRNISKSNPRASRPFHLWTTGMHAGLYVEVGFVRSSRVTSYKPFLHGPLQQIDLTDDDDTPPVSVKPPDARVPSILVRFNPNKHMTAPSVVRLLDFVRAHAFPGCRLLKFDYAIDIPVKFDDVIVAGQRKVSHFEEHSRYYGPRGVGQLKVYDKAFELTKNSKADPLTRCEWSLSPTDDFPCDVINVRSPLPKSPPDGFTPELYKLMQIALDHGASPKEISAISSYRNRQVQIKHACQPVTNVLNPSSLFLLALLLKEYRSLLSIDFSSADTAPAPWLAGALQIVRPI